MLKRLIIVTAIMLVILGGMGFMAFVFVPRKIDEAISKPKPPTLVDVVDARQTTFQETISAIGTIAAVHQASVNSEVVGKIIQIFFEPGATVKEGTPLIHLNDASEQADLANYQAQAELARLNLKRAQQLQTRQFASQQTVDQAQSTLDQAEAGIAKNKALIDEKLIKAPFDGVLGLRQVDPGQYVAAGAAIVTITDLDHLFVNFAVPEQHLNVLAIGQTVQVVVDAYPGKIFSGTLSTIEPQISADTRNVKLQASFNNPDHQLKPGMFSNVTVVLPTQTPAVAVPETAISYSLYGDAVAIVRQDGATSDGKPIMKAFRTAIQTGQHFGNDVLILSGVKPGDVVVRAGQDQLSNGSIVVPTRSAVYDTPATIPTN